MKPVTCLLLAAVLAFSCKSKKTVHLPDVPLLKKGETNTFKKGDRFILSAEENSCCSYAWLINDTVQVAYMPTKLAEKIETITSPADEDCAGCSTFRYHIYQCTTEGTDTLTYATIPNGGRNKGWAGMMISTYIIKVENE